MCDVLSYAIITVSVKYNAKHMLTSYKPLYLKNLVLNRNFDDHKTLVE